MTLLVNDSEVEELAQELAAFTGESIPEPVANALRERLIRERRKRQPRALADTLMRIGRECAALPLLDTRPADAIIGYNEQGVLV
jgi:antitoxin VapB